MYKIKNIFEGLLKYPKMICLLIGLIIPMVILPAIANATDCTESHFGLMFGPKKGPSSQQVKIGDIYVKRTGNQLQVSINTSSYGYYMQDNWLGLSLDNDGSYEKRIMNPPDGTGWWRFNQLVTKHEYTINLAEVGSAYANAPTLYLEVHVGFFNRQIVVEKGKKLDSARGYGSISRPSDSSTTTDPPTTIVRGDVVTPPTAPTMVETSTPSTTVAKTTVTTQKPRTVTSPQRTVLPFTGMNGWVLIVALVLMGTGWLIYKNNKNPAS
ncbi:MAG: hypothetical protein IBX64_11250 [Actinobacteria bacterium]|nr:hypothetical protein [Actinomycetota bacterium]